MSGFNLSAWALRHPTLVLFLMLVLTLTGVRAYQGLGRAEDPEFTIKVMVVTAHWPGATAREMELQVTDKLEKKLQEIPFYDHVASYSKPGEAVLKVALRQDTPARAVPEIWYQVRKKLGDLRHTLPQGVQGPFFNDEFGDTFGVIYAFSAEGFSPAELKAQVEEVRRRLLRVPHVAKVETYGTQDEKIYVELSHRRLATMGITAQQIFDALRREGAVNAAGVVETPTDQVPVRIATTLDSVRAVAEVPIAAGGRVLRVGDIAEVFHGYRDPPSFTMRLQGRPVIGLGVSMARDGNVLAMGQALDAAMARVRRDLPAGITVETVADQPRVVERALGEFLTALAEALAIVLAVSFISLGLRTGIVVALSVPLVLAITFLVMQVAGINLHRISLGALIIALGLLVDDAIIAVEMMVVKLEQGFDRVQAAGFAYTSTAFPMLTGTLVTAAGFVPVGFAKSAAGEYTNAIFWVVTIALVVSWIVAVVFTPYLGYHLLPVIRHAHGHDLYGTRFYRALRRVIAACVTWRKTVIAVTLALFAGSIVAFQYVPQQFFPSASRPELMVDLRLPGGASFAATAGAVARLERFLAEQDTVAHAVAYTGGGSPRFYLPLNPELPQANFAQFVIMTRGLAEREVLFAALRALFDAEPEVAHGRVMRLENGPPVGFPVQFRVTGSDPLAIRRIAEAVRDLMRANPHTRDVNLDWNELSKVVRLDIDRDKARALGVNVQDLSDTLHTLLSGLPVAEFRRGSERIDVVARAEPAERLSLDTLDGINLRTVTGAVVPLAQVATVRYELEEPVLWRRDRETVLTVRADIRDDTQAPVVTAQIDPQLDALRAGLPEGYRIDIGGTVEESVKSQESIAAVMPVMALIMVTVLMLQLQSFARLALVVLTAPLGLIGVALALLAFNQPFGFVATLGVIALAGMIMRNAVILVDQIDQDIAAGQPPWTAIVEAAVRRTRPILLTAAAAILAMVPLSRSAFWGPMAVAIMGGLTVATLLTLLFLPALYAAWFRVKRPEGAVGAGAEAGNVIATA